MEPKFVNDPLAQDFPEVEVEKNAKATYMENFEDYLNEEYCELIETPTKSTLTEDFKTNFQLFLNVMKKVSLNTEHLKDDGSCPNCGADADMIYKPNEKGISICKDCEAQYYDGLRIWCPTCGGEVLLDDAKDFKCKHCGGTLSTAILGQACLCKSCKGILLPTKEPNKLKCQSCGNTQVVDISKFKLGSESPYLPSNLNKINEDSPALPTPPKGQKNWDSVKASFAGSVKKLATDIKTKGLKNTIKDKAAERKEKADNAKKLKNLTDDQSWWLERSMKALADASLVPLSDDIIEKLNVSFNKYFGDDATKIIVCRNPGAKDPSLSGADVKDFKTACTSAKTIAADLDYTEFENVFGTKAKLPVLVCIKKDKMNSNLSDTEKIRVFNHKAILLQKSGFRVSDFEFMRLTRKDLPAEYTGMSVAAVALRASSGIKLYAPQAIVDGFAKKASEQ